MDRRPQAADNTGMLDVKTFKAEDLKGLSRGAVAELAATMLAQLAAKDEELVAKGEELAAKDEELVAKEQQLSAKDRQLADKDELISRRDHELKLKGAKLEKVSFELARLKAWKFGAKTEAMNAEQRRLFEETLAEDEASLLEQLRRLQGELPPQGDTPKKSPRKPRRQALPEHLRRVEHRHEPEDTTCPTPGCGRQMARVGEDISEKLDIVPAEFFVHRHVYGKWACKCCQTLVQEAVAPQIIDGGMPASGLVAHTLISRFVDHLPYYRQEAINGRSGVYTPRSTLAQWSGRGGGSLEPLWGAHRDFVLGARVLHADETPVAMLDPGGGQDEEGLCLGLRAGRVRSDAGRHLRLLPRARGAVPDQVPAGA